MFCYQCEETLKNEGCKVRGVCGKKEDTADLQDLLIYLLKGISIYGKKAQELNIFNNEIGLFIIEKLFSTITNVNFDDKDFIRYIRKALKVREELKLKVEEAYKEKYGKELDGELHDSATWYADSKEYFLKKAREVGVLSTENEDIRSLRELATYGVKGVAAYSDHAAILGKESEEIYGSVMNILASTTEDLSKEELINLVMETADTCLKGMRLLDEANTSSYGNPEITEVNIGVRNNPGILISGHDLKDMEELLQQTKGTGVDVYTHSEMLPANYYPAFKKYDHFVGNYGSSWWKQNEEFESFNGPILMTTNCITPVQESYKDRIFTTGMVGWPGVKHIPGRKEAEKKDFSEIIDLAKQCSPPEEIEQGRIIGGFAHNQVMELADEIVEAVKEGAIRRFVVMAGCDGRHKEREYFTKVAKELPEDAVILTAGCAKYRYNKLELGEINGIPRILDAGQCNDSYSLAYIALRFKEVTEVDDINELPISYDIAWYEQKAVCVLLSLLSLGIKGIRLGPRLPAFLSENITKVLVEKFNIKPVGEVEEDIKAMLEGK